MKKMFLFVLLAAGCGTNTRYPMVPVTGKVTFVDGTPLPPKTKVRFDPVDGGMKTSTGEISESGEFTLVNSDGRKGAEVGKYTVLLVAPGNPVTEFLKQVPREYCEGHGLLSAEVKEQMSPLEFKIHKAKKR
jgi:hypothetical protein